MAEAKNLLIIRIDTRFFTVSTKINVYATTDHYIFPTFNIDNLSKHHFTLFRIIYMQVIK
jgi:hypothetical protein